MVDKKSDTAFLNFVVLLKHVMWIGDMLLLYKYFCEYFPVLFTVRCGSTADQESRRLRIQSL